MKPRTPLPPRKSRIARKAPVKRVNPKRKASEFARTYGSRERVAFVKSLRCVACISAYLGDADIENHHIESGGKGRKADADKIVPLCPEHHEQCHRWGRESFAFTYEMDFRALAADTERRWQEHKERAA